MARYFSPKKGLKFLSELFITMALVLVFFSVNLGLINSFFPSGTGLKDLIGVGDSRALNGQGPHPVSAVSPDGSGDKKVNMPSKREFSAVLARTKNETKSKRANSITWKDAKQGMSLYHRDSIQTAADSGALIKFNEKNFLDVGENSLVIIQRLEEDLFLKEKKSFMVMVDGELRGRVSGSDRGKFNIQVATPGGIVRVQSQEDKKSSTDFKITMNPDKSSTLSVYSGMVELQGKEGTVRVKENQTSTLLVNGGPSLPEFLPDPPVLISPHTDKTLYYRDLPPQIQFRWKSATAFKNYHFVLDKTPTFQNPIVDEKLFQEHFMHGNLKEGVYYWKASVLKGGQESAFSTVGTIRLVRDKDPPILNVEFPSKSIDEGKVIIWGQTEPGAMVFIGGEKVSTRRDGRFKKSLDLKNGVNVIVVESIDGAGNVSYRSRFVNANF